MEQGSPVLIQFKIALQDSLTVEMENNVFLQQMIVKLLPAQTTVLLVSSTMEMEPPALMMLSIV